MPTVVIPFAGVEGKTRLHATAETRRELSLAMLGDVLAAAAAVGDAYVVTADEDAAALARELRVGAVDDPGGGQGAAVAAALARLGPQPVLIVNADLPCATPADLRALAVAAPALVEAGDGTTNALALTTPRAFAPLYGPGSAERFRAYARATPVAIPNLADDVDTLDDLERVRRRCGPRTQAALETLHAQAAR
jgi:2-phospho-L-lactate/phosphoenolpyruvate guanylyltransferase